MPTTTTVEIVTPSAIVRVHTGKWTQEERQAAILAAAQRFARVVEDAKHAREQVPQQKGDHRQ